LNSYMKIQNKNFLVDIVLMKF